jgi:hypothetical protein
MYRELVTALRKRAVDLPEKFSRNAENIDLLMKASDAIERLDMKLQGANAAIAGMQREIERMVIDSANSKPKWIPVSERLPENPHGLRREYFLVALESGCVESLGYDFDCNRWHITGSPVTHWMPLPQPPVEGI